MSRVVIPTSADWSTVNLRDGLCLVDGRLAELLHPHLWEGCVGAWSHALDQHAWDYSGGDNHGVRVGNVTDEVRGWTFNAAAIWCGVVPSINGATALTMSGWYYRGVIWHIASFARDTVQAGNRVGAYWWSDSVVYFVVDDTGSNDVYRSVPNIQEGRWIHVTLRYDGALSGDDKIRGFINGAEASLSAASATIPSSIPVTSDQVILGRANATERSCKLDDCRIWNRTIHSSDIQLLAQRPNIAYECRLLPRAFSVPGIVDITISPSSISSGEVFGTALIELVISQTSISSAETFGTLTLATDWIVSSTGISSDESFGTSVITLDISLSGIPSSEAFGTSLITLSIETTSIASQEAFGSHTLELIISASGIASTETFGTPSLELAILLSSIPSSEAFGSTTLTADWLINCNGIPTTENFGSHTVSEEAALQISPSAIASQESVPSPQINFEILLTSIGSLEAFGNLTLETSIICSSIPSQESVGTPSLTFTIIVSSISSLENVSNPALSIIIICSSITSGEVFGDATILVDLLITVLGIVSGEVFGLPIIIISSDQVLEGIIDLMPRYDIELHNKAKYDTILDIQPAA